MIYFSSLSFFLFIKLSFLLSSCILILLIFRNKIVHVRFSFSEFHLVHSLSGIPVQKGLSSKHSSELFSDSLKHFLNSSRVSYECYSHFKSLWRNITNRWFDIVRNPFYEVRRVLILYIKHLFINFFGGHSSSE